MADPTFMPATVFAKRKKEVGETPDFNPHAVSAPTSTQIYNKANQDSFKAFGVYIKKNVEGFLDKISTPEGMTEEVLNSSNLSGVGGMLGMMMGKNALTFNTADAIRAEELKAQGSNARQIWEKTESRIWNTGIRQEIDDSVMKIKDPFQEGNLNKGFIIDDDGLAVSHLSKLIDHPELFKAYPDLRMTTIRVDPNYSRGEASYSPSDDVITIGLTEDNKVDTQSVLHEIQHAIQAREGWQGGGNPDQFGGRVIVLPNGQMKKVNNFTEYQTLAGEWEARQTQLRAKLSAEDRKRIFPDDTSAKFDYPSGALNVHDPDYVLHKMRPKNSISNSISNSIPQFDRHTNLINSLESFVEQKRKTAPNKMLESMYFKGKQPDTDRGVARYLDMYMDELPEEIKNQLAMQNVRDLETGETLNAMMDGIRGGHIGQLRRLREEYQSGFYD